jgi:hypothetical protein
MPSVAPKILEGLDLTAALALARDIFAMRPLSHRAFARATVHKLGRLNHQMSRRCGNFQTDPLPENRTAHPSSDIIPRNRRKRLQCFQHLGRDNRATPISAESSWS